MGDKANIPTYLNGAIEDTPPNGIDIDQDFPTLDKPFIIAVIKKDIKFFEQAIQDDTPSDVLQNIIHTIHTKGCFCDENLVRYLYACTNKRDNKTDKYGNTALHTASKNGTIFSFFRFLDAHKNLPLRHQYKNIIAGLEVKNTAGETPFHCLASEGHRLFAKVILDQLNKLALSVNVNPKKDINSILSIKNNKKLTALDIAKTKKDTKMVELLYPENYYTCAACDKSFRFPDDLITHERTHTGKTPHGCNHCGKRFMKPFQLTVHIRSHTG
ncbi:MAG: C2H2-type zinc finger protein [Candidatus Cardinium sp.]|uniref:C2H2-type zinc finger protein n=1 Tax=Cardinium endosymbiont of Dermatophagoides farinae TaxID=2597823 RepID=UPI001CB8D36D|nr:C2H2-type zinc finger protein [Cardinium endosymbiont of Dermatophagoides farinae]UWW97120.1 MAG: C2H2-type zinc finger protein [Candidatus Cardinium sp.]